MKNKGFHIKYVYLLFCVLATVQINAQEGECINKNVITPETSEEYHFQSISLDSVATIATLEHTMYLADDSIEEETIIFYKYTQKEQECIAIKKGNGWLSTVMDIYPYALFGSGNDYSLVDLDGTGSKELLVHHCDKHSRGGMHGSHENSYCNYKLFNIDKGLVYYLGEDYYDYSSSYTGYRADDYEDSLQEEREMSEMDDEENWDYEENECSFYPDIKPGKLTYTDIICTNCDNDSLKEVSAIEYILKGDKLIRNKVITQKQ